MSPLDEMFWLRRIQNTDNRFASRVLHLLHYATVKKHAKTYAQYRKPRNLNFIQQQRKFAAGANCWKRKKTLLENKDEILMQCFFI